MLPPPSESKTIDVPYFICGLGGSSICGHRAAAGSLPHGCRLHFVTQAFPTPEGTSRPQLSGTLSGRSPPRSGQRINVANRCLACWRRAPLYKQVVVLSPKCGGQCGPQLCLKKVSPHSGGSHFAPKIGATFGPQSWGQHFDPQRINEAALGQIRTHLRIEAAVTAVARRIQNRAWGELHALAVDYATSERRNSAGQAARRPRPCPTMGHGFAKGREHIRYRHDDVIPAFFCMLAWPLVVDVGVRPPAHRAMRQATL